MNAELYTVPSVFETLSGEWDTLPDPARPADLFMSHDWQRIWWTHLHPGELAIITLRDDENVLAGIAPFFVREEDGVRTVRIVGCVDISDYLDILVRAGQEEPALSALLDFMLSDQAPAWEVIDLCNIPQDSPTLNLLPRLAESRGLTVETSVQDVCPVIRLPGSYEDYLAALSKKQRHELRRKRRRAEEQGVGRYIVGPEHDLEAEIEAFLGLMAMSTTEKAAFLREPSHEAFFREMGRTFFENGSLNLIFLTVGGERAAALWQFAYGDRMMLYNSGLNSTDFAPLSPGVVLLTYSIEDAIRRGFRYYDFLRGDEPYKYRMGAETTTVHNIVIRR
ncbi:MAG TPA: GNAT family N-acetyltransferase [Chloroflexi bacterium]|nr:GNAT family N-acetyltransferase [Chloroflexota bacterium]